MNYKPPKHVSNHITLFLLIICVLPTNLFITLMDLDPISDPPDRIEEINENSSFSIPRLMKKSNLVSPSSYETYSDDNTTSSKTPIFGIGNQEGAGEGTYQINDSLVKINTSSLSTQNTITSGYPSGHNSSLTTYPLTNFSQNSLEFQIMNVTADEDWRVIESETIDATDRNSTTFVEIAQKFEIKEYYANITTVELYILYNDVEDDDDKFPQGNVSIFSDDTGSPGTQLGTTTLEEGFGPLDFGLPLGPVWVTYNFSAPIEVNQGSYWLVFNDTGNQAVGSWKWYTQNASNGDAGDWAAKSAHGGSWAVNPPDTKPGDLLSAIRILPTDVNGNELVYSDPEELSMTYNTSLGGYALSSFIFNANDTFGKNDIHSFYTNNSVAFTLRIVGNYSYNQSVNKINSYVNYQVKNGSCSLWNLSFSTNRVDTNDIVRNRTISIKGIQIDWNASKIFWNDSSVPKYTDLTNNPNITWDGNPTHLYTYGNTTIFINMSSFLGKVTWYVCFNASNYVSSFDLERNALKMSLPYKANITDVVDIIFSVNEPGGNASYWIEYKDTNNQILANSNISYSGKTVTESWDINDTLSQITNINGSYELQVFWINAHKTKVGTFIRTLDLFVDTSFEVYADSEILIGELVNVNAVYKSIHNGTEVKNAIIWCDASWISATDVYMTQNSTNYLYNAKFATSSEIPGELGNITIATQVGWFINWTKIIYVRFVENSSLALDLTSEVLEWCQNTTLNISYLNSTGSSIPNATIRVNGTIVNYNSSIDAYIFVLNTTDYSGVGSYPDIPVNASHPEYLSQNGTFSFIITPGITNITLRYGDKTYGNETEILIPFSDNSADRLSLTFQYYHILTYNKLSTNEPEIGSLIPHISSVLQADNSWIIVLDPNQTGSYQVNFTFINLTNYYSAIFILNISVQNAQTTIHTNYVNDTKVYYSESLDFSVSFQNVDWNEYIILPDQGTIEISDETKLAYLNHTGDYYWFKFSSNQLSVGQHIIQIGFFSPNYDESVITLVFNVVEMPTLTIPRSNVYLTNNGTILVEDRLGIMIESFDTFRETSISALSEILLWLNGTPVPKTDLLDLKLTQPPFSFNLSTSGWQYSFYNLTIQIHTIGYQAQTFSLNITLLGRKTRITLEIEPGKNIRQGEDIIFITTLFYEGESNSGFGAGIVQQIPLEGVEITYYIVLEYENESTRVFEEVVQINESGRARYIIEGYYSKNAVGFKNITIQSGLGLSALPTRITLSASELNSYKIIPPIINIFDVIIAVLIIVAIFFITAIATGTTIRTLLQSRRTRKQLILKTDESIEKSFEDIKSIRLILAKHESGLPFYAEKTISDFQADTDTLSGMSTAISQFIEDVSGRMKSRNENGTLKEKFETISREGFHMLVWNGDYSSLVIISEIPLPDYYKKRLEGLGRELEFTFQDVLKNFFDAEKLPESVVRKIVRKYIPLHYFSAFVLNEGVLTLKNKKPSRNEKKMISQIKKLYVEKQGIQYFFSEQIISFLAMKSKRSKVITFLEKMISWDLLVECSQEELVKLSQ